MMEINNEELAKKLADRKISETKKQYMTGFLIFAIAGLLLITYTLSSFKTTSYTVEEVVTPIEFHKYSEDIGEYKKSYFDVCTVYSWFSYRTHDTTTAGKHVMSSSVYDTAVYFAFNEDYEIGFLQVEEDDIQSFSEVFGDKLDTGEEISPAARVYGTTYAFPEMDMSFEEILALHTGESVVTAEEINALIRETVGEMPVLQLDAELNADSTRTDTVRHPYTEYHPVKTVLLSLVALFLFLIAAINLAAYLRFKKMLKEQ